MSNNALENYLNKIGISFIRTSVGDKNIIEKMQEKNFSLGGEPSGHIILSDYSSTGDGLLASLEILRIMKEKNKKLSVISNLFVPNHQVLESYIIDNNKIYKNILLRSENKLNELKKRIKNNCKLIIRKSGTENKIRIMAESKSITSAKKVVAASIKIIKENDKEK